VIVVSEERGLISVAEHGILTQLPGAGMLKQRLAAFWSRHYGSPPRMRRHWWSLWQLGQPVLSLALASLLWFAVAYHPETVIRTFTVPIEFTSLPPVWDLREPTPTATQVTLSGPAQVFRLLDDTDIIIALSLADVQEGVNRLTITDQNLQLPRGLHMYHVDPQEITVTVYRRSQRDTGD
jgi:hypothetical protein